MKPELERFLRHASSSASPIAHEAEARWGLAALRGRLVEISARGASATLTAAIELVAEAQSQAEPVAWITLANSSFYPPDVADCGIDLAAGPAELSMPIQGRLVTLAQTHDAAVVCITDKTADTASIGSLVSLRADALRERDRDGHFHVTVRALKDKQRGPGWSWRALRGGPAGLR